MKNTLARVADPSFFLASTTAIVGAPSMTQLHRGMGGTAPQPTPPRRSYPHQPERQPLAAIERWALAERERRDSDADLGEVQRMALAMLGMDPA